MRISDVLIVSAGLVLIAQAGCAATAVTPRADPRRVKAGTWAGAGLELRVTDTGAQIEADCAQGAIPHELTVDHDGRLSVDGTWTVEHAGAVKIGEEPGAQPAHYAGRVSGSTMTLQVTLAQSNERVGSFTLTFGAESRIRKCR